MLNNEQISFAMKKMAEWLRIKENAQGAADVDHSSLLHRLLSGKGALPVPPPTAHSYPWYELGEGQKCPIDLRFCSGIVDNYELVLYSNGQWKWYDKDNNTIIYPPTGEIFKFTIEDNRYFLQKIVTK